MVVIDVFTRCLIQIALPVSWERSIFHFRRSLTYGTRICDLTTADATISCVARSADPPLRPGECGTRDLQRLERQFSSVRVRKGPLPGGNRLTNVAQIVRSRRRSGKVIVSA